MPYNKSIAADAENAPSLREAFAGRFRVGAAINSWHLNENSREYAVIRKQFNVFTLENESKPEPIHPEEGRYVFDRVDRFAAFGEKAGVRLRGHTLVWHSQCPDWFFHDENGNFVEKEVLLRRMKEHITTIVSRYRGKIGTWDVVNEVIRDEGGMRESKWYKIAGTDYIKEAFRCAHEADPAARLISTTTIWSRPKPRRTRWRHSYGKCWKKAYPFTASVCRCTSVWTRILKN